MTKPSNLNAPNLITIVRIAATPFFIWMLFADGTDMGVWRWGAGVFFLVAIASDALDGYLARSRGLVTDLGKLLDPIADKVLIGAALVSLSFLNELPWWVTIVVLVREVGVTIHRLIVAHDTVLAAAWMGKIKTAFQAVAIALALFPFAQVVGDWVLYLNIFFMAAAVILTIISGIDFVFNVFKSRHRSS